MFLCYGSIQSLAGITSTHLWFLPCYFVAVLLYNLLTIYCKRCKWLLLIVIVLLAFVSAYLSVNRDISFTIKDITVHLTGNGTSEASNLYLGMPLAINVAFSSIVFIYIGYLLRKLTNRYPKVIESKGFATFAAIVLGAVGYAAFKYNSGEINLIAMSLAQYGNYALFMVAATALSFATLLIATLIDNSLFAKYGQYTLPIYAFHLALIFIPSGVCRVVGLNVDNYPNVQAIVYGTIVLMLSCLLIPIIRKIDSNLIGEHK